VVVLADTGTVAGIRVGACVIRAVATGCAGRLVSIVLASPGYTRIRHGAFVTGITAGRTVGRVVVLADTSAVAGIRIGAHIIGGVSASATRRFELTGGVATLTGWITCLGLDLANIRTAVSGGGVTVVAFFTTFNYTIPTYDRRRAVAQSGVYGGQFRANGSVNREAIQVCCIPHILAALLITPRIDIANC
jgi:hypothetical protein